uniref:mRNA interferase YafQ n=1 Tax=Candidatus Kentrum sp. UNK TaxID=2126344 RepID=A0A451A134_9GAMM|nr:MAG: mRNA interferase YafQ [Candidatus Kentron sp. UNK]VFK68766.1 MAG: mRNA interferase YafQ [Candidatus Kentron sp. UNK]
MRTIKQTRQFKRDLKRESKGPNRIPLKNNFTRIVKTLANDEPLAHKHRDHALAGDWQDHRDCHVKADLILIYRKPNDDAMLQLVRLGSHSELGL